MLPCDVNSFGGSLVRATRRIGLLGLVCLLLLTVAPGSATAAAKPYTLDLGKRADYVAQTNLVQCVGASMQMMLNIMGDRNDRSSATQRELQTLARALSGRRGDGRQRSGASVRGWAGGLNQLDAGPYKLVGTTNLEDALYLAAKAIRHTGKPVGLLVWRGRHAWVMSGFRSTADPLTTDTFEVTAAIVMDPLYPHGSTVWGPSPKPREALSPKAVGRQFVPRRMGSMPGGGGVGSEIMASLSGKYVLVLPYEPAAISRFQALAI
jgi:hypothetical protein